MTRLEIDIKGMTCDGCSNAVKRVLSKIPEVKEADVDWKTGKAIVELSELNEQLKNTIKESITRAGYEVVNI